MLSFLVLADDLASDPRLAAPLWVEERYLPLREFGRRVTSATKVPIKIDGPLAERKLALFFEGRPVGETMRMAAGALGCHWVRIGPEWHLRVDAELRQDEAAAAEEEARTIESKLLAWAEGFAKRPGRNTSPLSASVAALIAKVGPSAVSATLLSGRPVVGTPGGEWGTPSVSLAGAGEMGDGTVLTGFRALGLSLRTPGVVSAFLVPHDEASGSNVMTYFSTGTETVPVGSALERQLKAWAVNDDPAVLRKRLVPLPSPKPLYPSGLMSLADGLARLHARTGLPLAAEAFRAPIGPFRDLLGSSVRSALDGLRIPGGPFRLPDAGFVTRTEKGWLLARPSHAWRLRPGEIPESRLVPLESRAPTLDEYAALADSLTEDQRRELGPALRPLANFRTVPLQLGYWGLIVYSALGPAERKAAERGIAFGDLPGNARTRWLAAVSDLAFESVPKGSWFDAYFLRRPFSDAGFRISRETVNLGPDVERPGGANGPNTAMEPYAGLVFRFSLTDPYPSAMMPLSPKAP